MSAKIIVIANQKGGTGKTTTVFNLGHALARNGKSILLADFDPQANLTRLCGTQNPASLERSMNDHIVSVLQGNDPLISPRTVSNDLFILPCSNGLAMAEVNLMQNNNSEGTLKTILTPFRSNHDYILIDTGPALGQLTKNALVAADSIILVAEPQIFSATALGDALKTIGMIKKRLNPCLEVEGILLSKFNMHSRAHREAQEYITNAYGKFGIFDTAIPQTARLTYANESAQSVFSFAPAKNAAIRNAYTKLAQEVMFNA